MGNARVIVWETEAAEEWKDLDFRAYPPPGHIARFGNTATWQEFLLQWPA